MRLYPRQRALWHALHRCHQRPDAAAYEHREAVTGGFTSRYKVHRLVRYEMFDDMEGAILREKQLKRWHRQWKINLIESENPHWADLAVGLGLEPLAPRGRRHGS